jgi:hypothetical protein
LTRPAASRIERADQTRSGCEVRRDGELAQPRQDRRSPGDDRLRVDRPRGAAADRAALSTSIKSTVRRDRTPTTDDRRLCWTSAASASSQVADDPIENYQDEVLTPLLTEGGGQGFCVNLSVDTGSTDIMELCNEASARSTSTLSTSLGSASISMRRRDRKRAPTTRFAK